MSQSFIIPGSQSNLTMVPGVNWKVDLRPFDGVASAPQDTTANTGIVT